ncbi:MAG: hypothetical protein WC796_04330 [Candidatus Pacearchaeota archaeon]|jgi:hypothetical protein
MTLIDQIYVQEQKTPERVLNVFPFAFFNPDCRYLGFKAVRRAIETGDQSFFLGQIRNNFLAGVTDSDQLQGLFRESMNRGIRSLNFLCQENLGEEGKPFLIPEINLASDLLEFTRAARDEWIEARNGKHGSKIDKEKLRKAYEQVRNWGLGYWILKIDTSPEVIRSIRHHNTALEWFNNQFAFSDQVPTDIDDLPVSWQTKSGVRVYGSDKKPIRSRLKILTTDGELKYGSLLMKMFLKGEFMDTVNDLTGVEFIVEDDASCRDLVNYFRCHIRGTGVLEKFKDSIKADKRSKHSSSKFGCTKFLVRPSVPIPNIGPPYPLDFPNYERIPVEVQILTIADHKQRNEDPDVQHEAYKRKQYLEVFPLWYPKDIYAPILVGK